MSYELTGIIVLGFGQAAAILIAIRGFREISRIQRAVAGLLIQESERLQGLIRQQTGFTR